MTAPATGAFDELFASTLRPLLLPLEQHRRRVGSRALLLSVTLAAVAVAVVVSRLVPIPWPAPLGPGSEWVIPAVAAALLGFGIGCLVWAPAYRSAFKHSAIDTIVRAVEPTLTYDPDGGLSRDTFDDTGLFDRRAERFHSEDYVSGVLGATAFEFCEVLAEYEVQEQRDGKTETRFETLFRGLLFSADFNKSFAGWTIVRPDLSQRFLGRFAHTLQGWSAPEGCELVKLEDPAFERSFCVYASDQVEARYILSPALMARLTSLGARNEGYVHLAFRGSRVFVAIQKQGRLFEPPLFRTLLNPATIRTYYEDVQDAVALVEQLSLNTRIWTKR